MSIEDVVNKLIEEANQVSDTMHSNGRTIAKEKVVGAGNIPRLFYEVGKFQKKTLNPDQEFEYRPEHKKNPTIIIVKGKIDYVIPDHPSRLSQSTDHLVIVRAGSSCEIVNGNRTSTLYILNKKNGDKY